MPLAILRFIQGFHLLLGDKYAPKICFSPTFFLSATTFGWYIKQKQIIEILLGYQLTLKGLPALLHRSTDTAEIYGLTPCTRTETRKFILQFISICFLLLMRSQNIQCRNIRIWSKMRSINRYKESWLKVDFTYSGLNNCTRFIINTECVSIWRKYLSMVRKRMVKSDTQKE